MLLTIDVGNTNITLGVFDGEDLIGSLSAISFDAMASVRIEKSRM